MTPSYRLPRPRPVAWFTTGLLVALVGMSPAVGPATRVEACAAVSRTATVRISGEEAIVVWDPERHLQHFIRTAAFEGASADFGFLVPTPARPELAEVDEGVFDRLFRIYQAPPSAGRGAGRSGARDGLGGGGPQAPVQVLERRTVAGLDAAVLAASDAGALERWLSEHGYPSGRELAAWLRKYVEHGWVVTAFRIDPREHAGRVFGLRAVRMSFRADTPFFPYSEPRRRGRVAPRPFRVSVVAPSRMRARAGTRGWRGRVGYANRPGLSLVGTLAGLVPPEALPDTAWLTVFDEPASVRGADDLFFEPDPEQSPVPSTLSTRLVPGAAAPRARAPR